jgi:hypothetical protein
MTGGSIWPNSPATIKRVIESNNPPKESHVIFKKIGAAAILHHQSIHVYTGLLLLAEGMRYNYLLAGIGWQIKNQNGEECDANARNDEIDRVEQCLSSHGDVERNI